jgi:hypothetical protein
MTKSSFQMGEKEKSTLTVDHDWLTKHIRIELGGETRADEYYYSPGAKTWSFDVGTAELHKVEVRLGMSLPMVPIFKKRDLKVLVAAKPRRCLMPTHRQFRLSGRSIMSSVQATLHALAKPGAPSIHGRGKA